VTATAAAAAAGTQIGAGDSLEWKGKAVQLPLLPPALHCAVPCGTREREKEHITDFHFHLHHIPPTLKK